MSRIYVAQVYVDWASQQVVCVSHDEDLAKARALEGRGDSPSVDVWEDDKYVSTSHYRGGRWVEKGDAAVASNERLLKKRGYRHTTSGWVSEATRHRMSIRINDKVVVSEPHGSFKAKVIAEEAAAAWGKR